MTALTGADAPTAPIDAAPTAAARAPAPWDARDPLRRALALLDINRSRVALSVTLGVLGLGSAVALAAVAAWLIARASQMPPVLELSIATVAVRTFGIGRGVFRYLERLVSHDVALGGMSALRTALYERLAAGRPEGTAAVRRGDLLARVGADVDAVGDAVVRGLLPAAVAAVLGLGTVIAMGALLPAASTTRAHSPSRGGSHPSSPRCDGPTPISPRPSTRAQVRPRSPRPSVPSPSGSLCCRPCSSASPRSPPAA
jgi:ATP-binding cassette subfamily C protein CydC